MTHTISKKKSNMAVKKESQSGFTLFIALIVSSLLLAIGFSLSTIILKQLVFANSGKESQLAFYAADSGAECALYWDRKDIDGITIVGGSFATSSSAFEDIFCGTGGSYLTGQVGNFSKSVSPDGLQATTTFYVDYSDRNTADNPNHKACAFVTVSKWIDSSSGSPVDRTQIDSRGYNVPLDTGPVGIDSAGVGNGAECDFSNSNRVVERALRLNY